MTRTLTALYDSREDAETVRRELVEAGVPENAITLAASDASMAGGASTTESKPRGILAEIAHFFSPEDDDRHVYEEGVRRGGTLLTARVEDQQEEAAHAVLDRSSAVDFDQRQEEWRSSGWSGASEQPRVGEDDLKVPIAEERLRVGKREVDRGTVRVHSRVIEEPVNEQVHLRQEQVHVDRTPVNESLQGDTEGLFEERTIEMTEKGEEAVVQKDTIVAEEVRVHRDVRDEVRDIKDTVRRTEVQVDDDKSHGSTEERPLPRP